VDELIERLGFWIDRSGATAVLREVGGGCHPATRSELALWDALEAARMDAERLDSGTIRIIERDEFGMQHTTAYSGVDLRAAIDQARRKGVQDEA